MDGWIDGRCNVGSEFEVEVRGMCVYGRWEVLGEGDRGLGRDGMDRNDSKYWRIRQASIQGLANRRVGMRISSPTARKKRLRILSVQYTCTFLYERTWNWEFSALWGGRTYGLRIDRSILITKI